MTCSNCFLDPCQCDVAGGQDAGHVATVQVVDERVKPVPARLREVEWDDLPRLTEEDIQLGVLWTREIERFEWHTRLIPDVLYSIRGDVAGIRASVTDNVKVSGSKGEPPTPANLGAVDDADELWAVLVEVVREIADTIHVTEPAAASHVWTRGDTVIGIRAGAGQDEAHQLGYMLERWMNRHALDTIRTPALTEPLRYAFQQIRRARAKWLPEHTTAATSRRRVCTVCGEHAVNVTFDDLDGIEYRRVDCRRCGAHYGHEPVATEDEGKTDE